MSEAEAYRLSSFARDQPADEPQQEIEEDAPHDAVVDSRPTRCYQAMLLLSGFLMTFQVIGINSVYGVFQDFYTSSSTSISGAHGQDALVSLVGTIGYGLTWGGSIFVNPMIRRTKNLKIITLSGTLIMSIGLFLASYSTKLWHLYLTQALLFGIGSSMLYFPIMSLSPRYFFGNRGFAMGVILAGSGIGGLALAPTLHALITRYGVGLSLRVLAAWNFVFMVPVACVVRQPPGFEARRRGGPESGRLNWSLIKTGTFLGQAFGSLLQASGNLVPLFYLTTYSISVLSYSGSTGTLLLALSNAINSVARIAMGVLADRVGRQNTMIASVLLSALSVLALWYNAARGRFLAFVVLYSVLAGGYNALLPTTIAEVYGVQHYDAVNGLIYFLRGLGAIAGAPIAGAILGSHRRGAATGADDPGSPLGLSGFALRQRYNDLVLYDGALLIGASVCVAYVRWCDAREKGVWRWRA